MYHSLAYPYLTYCNVVWGNTFKTHLKSPISLKRKAVRCLNFRNHDEFGTDALMLEPKSIKFCDLNKYLTCQFMHKLNSGIVPNVYNIFFKLILFMITTRVWVKVSMYPKLEMIMENQLSTMVVCYGTKLYF